MFYILHGNAFQKKQERLEELLVALKKKRPNTDVISVNDETWSVERIDALLEGTSLFDDKYIVVLSHIIHDPGIKKEVFKKIENFSVSDHIFILFDDELSKADEKKLSAFSYASEHISEHKKDRVQPTLFALTDAVGERKRKQAWELYVNAIRSGKTAEEIHGLIFWAVKSMRAAAISKTAEEAGMKAFPFKKAKENVQNYTVEELEKLSLTFIEILLEDRRGGTPLRISIERVLLEL